MTNFKTVLVIGSKGQLGTAMQTECKKSIQKFVFTDIDELDITSEKSILENIQVHKPDIIVNCSAYTAVDKAEDDVSNASLINSYAVEILSKICHQNSIFLIHVSTDYVFDGMNFQPYHEDDDTKPLSVYGSTKLNGEKFMLSSMCNGLIIRTSWLYSSSGSNFLKTILKYSAERDTMNVVFDQVGSPTYANDLADTIVNIIPKCNIIKGVKVYHYSNEGVCSWFDFARQIVDIAKINCSIKPIKSSQYPTKVKRPFYSVLDKTKIKTDFGIQIPYWLDSLKNCINIING